MKKLMIIMLGMMAALCTTTACSDQDSDLYDQLPAKVSEFISRYFPDSSIEQYTPSDKGCTVDIHNGPTLVFDTEYQWTNIDGDGSVLPQVLLFDQLPPALYQYLQQEDDLNQVFMVSRSSTSYVVTLLSQTLTYDIADDSISGKN